MSGGFRRLAVLGAAFAVLLTGACGSSETAKPAAGATTSAGAATPALKDALTEDQYLENGGEFVDAATKAKTWDAAEASKVKVELNEMSFTPKNLTFEAGKPYVIELVNKGKVKHEFTAGQFFRSVATRKAESESSEVKVPFFTEIEVLAGKTVELFVIPIMPGTFELLCEIEGHREAGMEGTITVTGSAPVIPAPVLGSLKAGKWLQNGPDMIEAASKTWDATAKTLRIEAGEEGAKMFFRPKNLDLKVGTPYKIELVNIGKIKHEYTAAEFFPTVAFRKAQDVEGEFKGLLLKEAEVKAGKQMDLYLIPTKAGKFDIICEIDGHSEAGMVGTITVTQ
jgi:uncharacterized cupredoxin-like copper-binding protein